MAYRIKKVLFTAEEIRDTVRTLAAKISRDYQGETLYVVVIMNGALFFAADLTRSIDSGVTVIMDSMHLSSRPTGTTSSGNIELLKDLQSSVAGQKVLIVEDVIDTGQTLKFAVERLLNEGGAASVEVCTLLTKPSRRIVDVNVKYCGKEIDDVFVVGYGLDLDGEWRNLPEIVILENDDGAIVR